MSSTNHLAGVQQTRQLQAACPLLCQQPPLQATRGPFLRQHQDLQLSTLQEWPAQHQHQLLQQHYHQAHHPASIDRQRPARHPAQQQQQQQCSPPLPPQLHARHKYPQSRSSSLAQALHVTPEEARAMLHTYPALRNFNHQSLASKLQALSELLQVAPQQLGPALVQAPKVLGYSLYQVEKRLVGLTWLQPDRQQLSQLVLQAPLLLTWSSKALQTRLLTMGSLLGLSSHALASLLQQHPLLLPASSHLQQTLHLLQQLFVMAAASEQSGFGTGILAVLAETGSNRAQHAGRHLGAAGSQLQQQQQQGGGAAAVAAAARQFALTHPQVLLVEAEVLQSQVASMQATSGLPAAQVAAMLLSQPALLLAGAPTAVAAGVDRQMKTQRK